MSIALSPSPQRLDWRISHGGGTCVVSIVGELDIVTVDELESALPEPFAGDATWVYDLEGVTFVDAAGLDFLIRSRERLQKLGIRLLLARTPVAARRLLVALSVSGVFEYHESDSPPRP